MTFLDSSIDRANQSLPAEEQNENDQSPDAIEPPEHSAEQGPDVSHHDRLIRWIAHKNIAEDIDDDTLAEIGMRSIKEYEIDKDSRSEWVTKSEDAMKLAMQVAKEKTYPWPKASNVIFPLMTSAAIQFNARAYPAIIANRQVVKGIVVGDDAGVPAPPQLQQMGLQFIVPPGAKLMRANKIADHMSWQLLDEMPEWEAETDQLLVILPIVGCVFRKTYFDPQFGRNFSVMRSPMKIVINYKAKSMETTPRITEEVSMYPREIEEAVRAEMFLDIDYSNDNPESPEDEDAPREFIEQHRYLDLDNDGYSEPYIVTVHVGTQRVVRIKARYDEDGVLFSGKDHKIVRINPVHYYTKYDFVPNPDGGIYGVGFGQLLRPINDAVNTSLNLLIDGGHLANTSGGFIGRGLSMNTGAIRFQPGEWKQINIPGQAIKDNLVPLQFSGPNMVLFQLLQLMIEAGREVAAVKDVLTGEQQQHNVPATTTLALIEQGLKVFTAIYKRVYRSLKDEFKKLYRLNRLYLPEETGYRVGDAWKTISQKDYATGSGVEPISDPSMVSDMQRLAQAQFLQPFAQDPLINQVNLRRRIFEAARIERPEELINPQPPPNPALIAKAMEIQIKAEREKAAELKDLAQAILLFAQADAVVGDAHLAWVRQQLEGWKAQFEASATANPSAPQGGGGGGEGAPPAPPQGPPGMPNNFAPSPDHNAPGPMGPIQASPNTPMGGGPSNEPPPVQGARKAPDGRWYINDPNRPGKFLMLAQTPQSLEARFGG